MNLFLMLTISNRGRLADIVSLYKNEGIDVILVALGQGTANSEILDLFGLESSEKAILFNVITDEKWNEIKTRLKKEIHIDILGIGISFIVPLASIGGKRELMFLLAGQNYEKGDESVLKDTNHEMLLVIANQGYSDHIMDAARNAGAGGGTVIHAKGSGMEKAEHFLGISLAAEKELIFIVTKTVQKNMIMQAIMKECGMKSKAKAIVFSIPVTDTAGLRLQEED